MNKTSQSIRFRFVVDPMRFFGNPYIPSSIQKAIREDGTVDPKNIIGIATLTTNPDIILIIIRYNGRRNFIPLTCFRRTPPPQKLQKIIAEKGEKRGRYIIANINLR